MRSSYQEAQFVLKNSSVLCPKEVVCFAEDYIFDYLMSTLPIEQQKKRFDPLAETLSSTSFLTDTLKAIVAQDCNLSGGSLSRCKLDKAKVDRCDFTRCDFSGAELSGLDFSHCTIEGATWTIDKLKNVTVTTAQAVDLARLIGLNIVP